METVHIGSWGDLEQFGVNALTGEACAYGMRLLCDVNADGRDMLLDYLGLPMTTQASAPWNSSVNNEPSVGSFMLHRRELLHIAEFAMIRNGAIAIVYKADEAVMGIYTEHMAEQYQKLVDDWPNTTGKWTMRGTGKSSQPGEGSRNTHAFTGRTA
jgi:hypothetical protein